MLSSATDLGDFDACRRRCFTGNGSSIAIHTICSGWLPRTQIGHALVNIDLTILARVTCWARAAVIIHQISARRAVLARRRLDRVRVHARAIVGPFAACREKNLSTPVTWQYQNHLSLYNSLTTNRHYSTLQYHIPSCLDFSRSKLLH